MNCYLFLDIVNDILISNTSYVLLVILMNHEYPERMTFALNKEMQQAIKKYSVNISESSFVRIAITEFLKNNVESSSKTTQHHNHPDNRRVL